MLSTDVTIFWILARYTELTSRKTWLFTINIWRFSARTYFESDTPIVNVGNDGRLYETVFVIEAYTVFVTTKPKWPFLPQPNDEWLEYALALIWARNVNNFAKFGSPGIRVNSLKVKWVFLKFSIVILMIVSKKLLSSVNMIYQMRA